jgi:hypothetical protein
MPKYSAKMGEDICLKGLAFAVTAKLERHDTCSTHSPTRFLATSPIRRFHP